MANMLNDDRESDFGSGSGSGLLPQPPVLTGGAAMGFVGAYVDCVAVGQAV